MPLIGMFEARCFRLQAAEGGVGVGGSGKAGGGGLPPAACATAKQRVDSAQMIPMAGNIAECSCVVACVRIQVICLIHNRIPVQTFKILLRNTPPPLCR